MKLLPSSGVCTVYSSTSVQPSDMITGDHKLTAVAIARELNIYRPGDLALTGEDLDFLPQEVLEQEDTFIPGRTPNSSTNVSRTLTAFFHAFLICFSSYTTF